MHQVSPLPPRICLWWLATPLHQFYHSLAGLPSCVTPSLGYYRFGFRARHDLPPKGPDVVWAVSITDLARDALMRVREYQPVVHRLRLSASP